MEIKTTKEIGNEYSNFGRRNKNKKWIALDDLIDYCLEYKCPDDNTDNEGNEINSCNCSDGLVELRKALSKF